jgi:PAS domain S-box-containing protein
VSAREIPSPLELENAALREQLAEAENVLAAIRRGEIDAVVVESASRARVFTLEGADHPYRILVECMNEGAATLTADGVVLYGNRRLGELLGVSTADVLGSKLADWLSPPDSSRLECMLRSGGSSSCELSLRAGSGKSLPVHVSVSPLALEGMELRCAILADVTLAKRSAALEATAERERLTNVTLRDADRRKDEFLATLAHELRNPLAPIRAAAHVIKVLNLSDPRLAKAQGMIERQVTHLSRLVDELMELSRVTLGRIELQLRNESLAAILTTVADAIQPSIDIAGHELEVELPDEPLVVLADAVRMSQAISNVLENAVKYTPRGGRVSLRARREGRMAAIVIEDTGIGIQPDMIGRVFDMFVQGDRAGQRGGLGIGLALTRKLLELHGGTIDVASAGSDQGTQFTIRIPLSNDNALAESGPVQQLGNIPPRRVLIVDDNVDAAESLRMLLELSGHIVAVEYGGAAALDTVESFRPEVVLLDIGLPDVDGYEVAREIRARHGMGNLKLVAVSGWGQAEDKQRAAEAGIDLHFTKPIDSARLSQVLSAEVRPARDQKPHSA